jgi:DNA polymerase III subunit delta
MPPAAATSVPMALIHGDDDFSVKQRARQIYQQWCAELGGMDHETLDAQAGNSGEALRALARLREALQTLPFFGSGKAVWFQNCSFLGDDRTATAQAVSEALADLAQELKTFSWQGVRLLISAGKVDKRRTFYKTVEKLGLVEGFAAWSIDDKDWLSEAEMAARRSLRSRKKEITEEALAALVNSVGPHRQQLANEVEKLSLYVGERPEIDLADVQTVVTRNKQARAFALADALGDRHLPRLLRSLDEALWDIQFDSQKSEIGLLYGLIAKVRSMLLLQEMVQQGWVRADSDYGRFKSQLERVPADAFPEDKKFNPLAMHPFMLHRALGQSRNYSRAELVHAMDRLLECNQRLIFSTLDEALVLQQTLVEIARRDANEPEARSEKRR